MKYIAFALLITVAFLLPYISKQKKEIQYLSESLTSHKSYQISGTRLELLQKDTTRAAIIFMGDSHIEYGNWAAMLQLPIANYGVGGNKAAWMVQQIDAVLAKKPEVLMINGGVNDIGANTPTDSVVACIAAIFEKAKAVPKVYYTSILPMRGAKQAYNDSIRKANSLLRALCTDKGVVFVPFADSIKPAYYHRDSTHLNIEGYKAWCTMLKAQGLAAN